MWLYKHLSWNHEHNIIGLLVAIREGRESIGMARLMVLWMHLEIYVGRFGNLCGVEVGL